MGMTSEVRNLGDGRVTKRVLDNGEQAKVTFKNELAWLRKLEGTGIAPKLLHSDVSTLTMTLEDCGEKLSKTNAPVDWRDQLLCILSILGKYDCQHNDLSEEEIVVDSKGNLRILDFGFASSVTGPEGGGEVSKKGRIFRDANIVELFDLLISNKYDLSEPHCVILWDIAAQDSVRVALNKNFDVLREITYQAPALQRLGGRKKFIQSLYGRKPASFTQKGITPFVLFVVMDPSPTYGVRRNAYSGRSQLVNTNIFDFKSEIRQSKTGFLHASDTFDEAYRNLSALAIYSKRDPLCYVEHWRNRWNTTEELIAAMEKVRNDNFEYCFIRPRQVLDNVLAQRQSGDIDLLTNDYLRLKTLLGGVSYKQYLPVWRRSHGLPIEEGGNKVAAHGFIGGEKYSYDLRHVGDGYFDSSWQKNTLASSELVEGFRLPTHENLSFFMLYHAFQHKPRNPFQYLMDHNLMEQSEAQSPKLLLNKAKLELGAFLDSNSYSSPLPDEVSIAFQGHFTDGNWIMRDFRIGINDLVHQRLQRGRFRMRRVYLCKSGTVQLRAVAGIYLALSSMLLLTKHYVTVLGRELEQFFATVRLGSPQRNEGI